MKRFQMFADEIIKTSDIEPVISYDYATKLSRNLNALRDVLGIQAMRSMPEGSQIKLYKVEADSVGAQPAEGDVIPLTHITRKLARTVDLVLNKFRKETTIDAIQNTGRENALNVTDDKLVSIAQDKVLTDFYTSLTQDAKPGGVTPKTSGLQPALSAAWGAVRKGFTEYTATPIYFVSVDDVADYLGTANPLLATAGGMTYIENFLSLGTVVISPEIEAGAVYATAKENLGGAFVPTNGAVGQAVGTTADDSGLVGIKHYVSNETANIGTLMLSGAVFFPELVDHVYKVAITQAKTDDTTKPAGK